MLRSLISRPRIVIPRSSTLLAGARAGGCDAQYTPGVRFVSESKIADFKPQTENRAKVRRIFNDYYKANYAHTVPSRFYKELVAAADENKDGIIEFDEMKHLLERIGAADKLSDEEIEGCLDELGAPSSGSTTRSVTTKHMLDVLLHPETDPSA